MINFQALDIVYDRLQKQASLSVSQQLHGPASHVLAERRQQHATAAVTGFFKAISLHNSPAKSLQDALRILGVWFKHGQLQHVRLRFHRSLLLQCMHAAGDFV